MTQSHLHVRLTNGFEPKSLTGSAIPLLSHLSWACRPLQLSHLPSLSLNQSLCPHPYCEQTLIRTSIIPQLRHCWAMLATDISSSFATSASSISSSAITVSSSIPCTTWSWHRQSFPVWFLGDDNSTNSEDALYIEGLILSWLKFKKIVAAVLFPLNWWDILFFF